MLPNTTPAVTSTARRGRPPSTMSNDASSTAAIAAGSDTATRVSTYWCAWKPKLVPVASSTTRMRPYTGTASAASPMTLSL